MADALQFITLSQGADNIAHYLDDFIILGESKSKECAQQLLILTHICGVLGVPLADEKREGPTSKMEVLGIELDTELMQMSLPAKKLTEIKLLLASWRGKKMASKVEIQTLVGHLQKTQYPH